MIDVHVAGRLTSEGKSRRIYHKSCGYYRTIRLALPSAIDLSAQPGDLELIGKPNRTPQSTSENEIKNLSEEVNESTLAGTKNEPHGALRVWLIIPFFQGLGGERIPLLGFS